MKFRLNKKLLPRLTLDHGLKNSVGLSTNHI